MVASTEAGDVLYGPGGDDRSEMARLWPVPLVVGALSVILGFVVLSYNTSSLAVVSILVGVSLCYTGVTWLMMAFVDSEHRWFIAIAGALLLAGGVVAFVYPDETLRVISLIVGWSMLLSGILGIAVSLANRDREHWWIGLVAGLLQLGLGGWAVRETDRSVILLLTIVGIYCVIGGISSIVAAFQLRAAKESQV
jgi:uncharacterized membrane protein HdeD (DUF308 family)